ncbi:MAG: hypothetical protein ACYC2U_08790 [Candidatus Amoebophilus sp.]
MSEARKVSFEEFKIQLNNYIDAGKRLKEFADVNNITQEEIWKAIDRLGIVSDKPRDDILFNCDEPYESYFVASRYGNNRKSVKDFLSKKCDDKTIYHFNHQKIYELIKKELRLQIPD